MAALRTGDGLSPIESTLLIFADRLEVWNGDGAHQRIEFGFGETRSMQLAELSEPLKHEDEGLVVVRRDVTGPVIGKKDLLGAQVVDVDIQNGDRRHPRGPRSHPAMVSDDDAIGAALNDARAIEVVLPDRIQNEVYAALSRVLWMRFQGVDRNLLKLLFDADDFRQLRQRPSPAG